MALDDAIGIGVLADQVAGHLHGRAPWVDLRAAFGQQLRQPVPLGIRPLGQPGQVNFGSLCAAHQGRQRLAAQCRIRAAVGGRPREVGDQPGVRGQRGHAELRVGIVGDAGRKPARGPGESLGHRHWHRVERGDGGVDRVRPCRQVRGAGTVALLLRRGRT